MTRPISDIDLAFLENVTALCLDLEDQCVHLAYKLTTMEQVYLLRDIVSRSKRIREKIINHKPHIARRKQKRAGSGSRPKTTREASSYDPQSILPQKQR